MRTRLISSFTPLLLASCVMAKGNNKTGDWAYNSLGTDATTLAVRSTGMSAGALNQSKALKAVTDAISKMWSSYLMLKGFEFISGKYYDHLGNELNAGTTIKLEELRNAHSLAEGEQALRALEMAPLP